MRTLSVSLDAPAKVNLHLGVHQGRDERGYHAVDSCMAALDLCDELTVEDAPEFSLAVTPGLDVPPGENTCERAAFAFAELCGREPRVRITLRKRIPAQSGLGGASSDAASVIRGLARQWDVPQGDARLREACARVGADVPFFLDPVPTLLTGAGDVPEESFPHAPRLSLALVRPDGPGVSTPAAYAEFDRSPEPLPGLEPLRQALRNGTVEEVAACLANNLAPAACRLNPAAGEVARWLGGRPGVLGAQLTGSGSCSFAVCRDAAAARRVAADARVLGWWSCATGTRAVGDCPQLHEK